MFILNENRNPALFQFYGLIPDSQLLAFQLQDTALNTDGRRMLRIQRSASPVCPDSGSSSLSLKSSFPPDRQSSFPFFKSRTGA